MAAILSLAVALGPAFCLAAAAAAEPTTTALAAALTSQTARPRVRVEYSSSSGPANAVRTYPSVAAARDALRAQKRSHGGLPGNVTVELGPGVHAPFVLDARDSGTPEAHIVYTAASTEGPPTVVSAGVPVPPQLCKERKTTASDPVVVCDLSSLGLNQSTTLGFRALAVSFGGDPAILARYPNVGNGSVWNGTYQWLYADAGGNSSFSLNASSSDAKRVASWASIKGATIQGYFVWDWNDAITAIVGGGANADGSATIKVAMPGMIKPLARFIGMNMLAELDAPNEYYIDAEQEKLYAYLYILQHFSRDTFRKSAIQSQNADLTMIV